MQDILDGRPSRFNMGEGQEENAIITSTGRYVVAFDFTKVKKKKLGSYVIKRCVLFTLLLPNLANSSSQV